MIAQNIKQHNKNVLLGKTSPKYVTKLVCIVSSHVITDFSCARENVTQKCPELILNQYAFRYQRYLWFKDFLKPSESHTGPTYLLFIIVLCKCWLGNLVLFMRPFC